MICFAKIVTNCSHFLNSRYNITADEGNVNTQSHYKIVIAQKSSGNIENQCSQNCILTVVYSTLSSIEQILSLDIPLYHQQSKSGYSNSTVPGGLDVRSYITRLTPLTSLMMRLMTRCNTSKGISDASAVMKSTVSTARRTTA